MGKIAPKEGVEVFVNANCNITILQESFTMGEQLVIIEKEDVPKVIEFLQQAYEAAQHCMPENKESSEL